MGAADTFVQLTKRGESGGLAKNKKHDVLELSSHGELYTTEPFMKQNPDHYHKNPLDG